MSEYEVAIDVKNISKTFYIFEEKKESLRELFSSFFRQGKTKKFKAVDDVSFKVHKGEFLGIIGRNGSGKSTLLKMIAGIYGSDNNGGSIKVNGSMVPFLELGVGFNAELTGRENVFLNGTILGMSKKFIHEKYKEIVDFAEIGDFINMPVKNYSSGMKVRLAFSIAVQANADIYILDEVFSVGDAAFQQKSRKIIERFVEEGKTIIYVSHGLANVAKYSQRVIWLEQGKLMYDGDTEDGIKQYEEILHLDSSDRKYFDA